MTVPLRSAGLIPCCIISACIGFTAGCEDLLPEYDYPETVFENFFYSADTFMIEYYEAYDDITLPGRPKVSYAGYRQFRFAPQYRFQFTVKNIYEETIQGQLATSGVLEIWHPDHPTVKKRIPVDNSHVPSSPHYVPSTNTVTIPPGSGLTYSIPWGFNFDNGQWIHEVCSGGDRYVFSSRFANIYSYQTYPPQKLKLRFTVSLIASTPAVIADTTVTVNLRGIIHSYEPGTPAPSPYDQ